MPRPYGVVDFVILQYPQISPSSVTCGDSFPQRGKPFVRSRAVIFIFPCIFYLIII